MALLLSPVPGLSSRTDKADKEVSPERPIIIHSDTLEVDQEKKLIVFQGKVKAKKDDMVVDCQKMFVYYTGNPVQNKSGGNSGRIEKIIALGDVVINSSQQGIARAGKAVFYQKEDKVELTESPFIQQGPDSVSGQKIIIFLKDNRSIIQGGETERVKATIFPRDKKTSNDTGK